MGGYGGKISANKSQTLAQDFSFDESFQKRVRTEET